MVSILSRTSCAFMCLFSCRSSKVLSSAWCNSSLKVAFPDCRRRRDLEAGSSEYLSTRTEDTLCGDAKTSLEWAYAASRRVGSLPSRES
ncbi:hypothetical protein B0H14DRAFT_2726297, partial [Mycena olivaceomarginata]